MNCTRCREALSAISDGEDPGLPTDRVEQHLLACDGCRAYSIGLGALAAMHGRAALEPQHQPAAGLTSRIVSRLRDERLVGPTGNVASAREPVGIWRVGLFALAVGQLLAALQALLGSANTDALHANHDLGAVELALSACFLLAALRPGRAAGFVPLLAAVVVCLAVVAVADVASGRIAASSELPHLVDALGLVTLIAVARRHSELTLQVGLA